MADDSDPIVENIVLDLKTNWESELRTTLKQMNQFKDQVADISKAAVNSYGNFQKQFLAEFGNMTKNTVGEIRVLIGASRRELGELQKLNKNFIKMQDDALSTIEKRTGLLLDQYSRKASLIQSKAAAKKDELISKYTGTKTANLLPGMFAAIDKSASTQLKGLQGEQRDAYIKLLNDVKRSAFEPLYLESTKVHAKVASAIGNTANSVLTSVTRTVSDVSKQYTQLKNTLGLSSDTGKILRQSDFLKNAGTEYKSVLATMKDQEARLNQLSSLRKTAQNMLMLVRKEDAEIASKYIKTIADEQKRVTLAFEATGRQAIALKDIIKTAMSEAVNSGKQLQNSLKAAITPTGGKLTGLFQNSFKNFADQINAIRSGDAEIYQKSISQGRAYQNQINETITKLKEWDNTLKSIRGKPGIDTAAIDSMRLKVAENLNSIKQFQVTFREMQKDFSQLNISKIIAKPDTSGFRNVVEKIREIKSEMTTVGTITGDNFRFMTSVVDRLGNLYSSYAQRRMALTKQIEEIERNAVTARTIAEESNIQRVKEAYNGLAAFLENRARGLRGVMESYSVNPAYFAQKKQEVQSVAKGMQDAFADLVRPTKEYRESLKNIQQDFIRLQEISLKSSKHPMFTTELKKEAEQILSRINTRTEELSNTMSKVTKRGRELNDILRSGRGDERITAQISQFKRLEETLGYVRMEMGRINAQAPKLFERIQGNLQQGGGFGAIMTWIRNFRWQYAAVMYVAYQAVNAFRRFIFGTMDEIGQFQKDALALAASFAYNLMGDMKTKYQQAYGYAKELILNLKDIASQTAVPYEDLLMLVKTLSQTGIVPRTDEDLKRIATIGSAIHAVTEGMANAGVQMRQELSALILGRQRATDQLAMMFRYMGVDIKKVMASISRGEGTMLEVLAEQLKPYRAMLDELSTKWPAVKQQLETTFSRVQLFAGENFTDRWALSVKAFAEEFYDTNKKELTELGKGVATAWRGGMEILMTGLDQLWTSLKEIGSAIKSVFEIFWTVGEGIVGINENTKNLTQGWRILLDLVQAISGLFIVIGTSVKFLAKGIEVVAKTAKYLLVSLAGVGEVVWLSITGQWEKIPEVAKRVGSSWDEVTKSSQEFINTIPEGIEQYKKMGESIRDMGDALRGVKAEQVGLNSILKLPVDMKSIIEPLQDAQKMMKNVELQGLEGPRKFQRERELSWQPYENLPKLLEINKQYMHDMRRQYQETGTQMTEDDRKVFMQRYYMIQEAGETLERLQYLFRQKESKQTADWMRQEEVRNAGLRKEWNDFLIETSETPVSEWQKLQKWVEKTRETIKKLQVTNKKYYDDTDAEMAYTIGIQERMNKILKESSDTWEDFQNRITSHEFKSPFIQIDLDAKKLYEDLEAWQEKYGRLRNDQLEKENLKIRAMIDTRKQLISLELAQKNYNAEMDVALRNMNYWKETYSPITQRQARVNSLVLEYQKNVMGIAAEYQRTQIQIEQMQRRGNTEGLAAYIEMRDNYVKQLEIMKLETERLVWKELNPLWNDMIEMSKSWADSMTDAIADFVDQTKTAQEAIKDLMKSIERDVLRAVIKRTITEPIMGLLGSGEPGSPTILQKMTGKSGVEGPAAMSKIMEGVKLENDKLMNFFLKGQTIIPVRIMEEMPIVTDAYSEANQSIVDMMAANKDSVDATKQAIDSGFSKEASYFMQLISAATSGNVAGAAGAGSGLLGGLIGKVTSLFGGGAGVDTDILSKVGGVINRGMAEGGVITEPIVGKGLKSGTTYTFGEKTPYGKNELVSPIDKLSNMVVTSNGGQSFTVHMPIQLNAIDTQSGVDFLMKNSGVLEGNIIKMIRSNRRLRDAMRSY